MTRAQKLVIAILALLTVAVFGLAAVVAVSRLDLWPPDSETSARAATALPTAASTATAPSNPTARAETTTAPFSATPAAHPTPVGAPCAEWDLPHGFGFFQDRQGLTHFVGEPRNTDEMARERVTVIVQLFNQQGVYVGSTAAPLLREVVPPGQAAPFNTVLPASFPDWQTYALEFQCAPADAPRSADLDLQVIAETARPAAAGSYALSGQVKNVGKAPARTVQVIVVLYDAKGWVINAARVDAVPSLAPGASSSFDVLFDTVERTVARDQVYVQATLER